MFKRIFWIGLGVVVGVLAVSKAEAYLKANTPDQARQFVLGPDQDNVAARTLQNLVSDFREAQQTREAELNAKYSKEMQG